MPGIWEKNEMKKNETFTHEAPVEAPVDQTLANNINFNNTE